MNEITCTIKEFADKNQVNYAVASGLIGYLVKTGQVSEAGNKPSAGGKGKPSKLYKIPQTVTLLFKE